MNHQGGWDFLDHQVIKFFDDILWSNLTGTLTYIDEIKSIAAIFLLLVLSYKAWKGMMGDYELFDIVELGKPFILIVIIINWGAFLQLIMFPIDLIEDHFSTNLTAQTLEISLGIEERNNLTLQLIEEASEISTEVEAVESSKEEGSFVDDLFSSIGESIDGLSDYAGYMLMTINAKMQMALTALIEWITLLLFQVCVYLVYLIRTVFCSILGYLGPIAFAFSILPGFKTAYLNWISKFVTTYLYGTITFIAIKVCLAIVHVGLESELQFLEAAVNDPTYTALLLTQGGPQTGAYIIALLLGIGSIICVPIIATWMLPNGGIGGAVSKGTAAIASGGSSLAAGAAKLGGK